MKNLDLNAYGVSEMNHQEMVETDGGDLFGIVRKVTIAVSAFTDAAVKASVQVLKEGGTTVTNTVGTK